MRKAAAPIAFTSLAHWWTFAPMPADPWSNTTAGTRAGPAGRRSSPPICPGIADLLCVRNCWSVGVCVAKEWISMRLVSPMDWSAMGIAKEAILTLGAVKSIERFLDYEQARNTQGVDSSRNLNAMSRRQIEPATA